MSRSSIFNFEALREFKPALPRGLLTAAALVLLLEISVRVVPEKYLVTFYSRLGFGVYMENVVLPEFKDPKIAIFGTSRAADAFMPSMLDEALNLPQNSIAQQKHQLKQKRNKCANCFLTLKNFAMPCLPTIS